MKPTDITGKSFGYWTVLKRDEPHPGKQNSYWICRCKCGAIRTINRSTLVNGRSQSCGCKPSDKRKGINATHNMSNTRIYKEWAAMKRRCKNPNDKSASSYYGKHISVCEEWSNNFVKFYEWSIQNGYSDDLTIDRIDNSKGYSPENCRWISNAEQQQNRTNNIIIEYNGQSWCLRTLCEQIGFPYKLAHQRYIRAKRTGKPITSAKLFEPVHSEKIAYKFRNQDGAGTTPFR